MDQGPLVSEKIEAGARFLGEFQKRYPIEAAFWLKESDEGAWWLYVASDQITDENFHVAYKEVGRVARNIKDPWFDLMEVKVIGEDDPLAKGAADIRSRYPAHKATRLYNRTFGGVAIDEIYIYPTPLPAPIA
jgi:hypothetical protein